MISAQVGPPARVFRRASWKRSGPSMERPIRVLLRRRNSINPSEIATPFDWIAKVAALGVTGFSNA
jgi:hypothetical protein